MLNRLFLIVVLTIASTSAVYAQDQIIRIYGDTIDCYIEREDARFIYYKANDSNKAELEIISLKEVVDVIYDTNIGRTRRTRERIEAERFRRFQISAAYGYSWIISEDELYGDEFNIVYDDLREGSFLDFRLNCFLNEEVGLGALYSTSRFENTEDVGVAIRFSDGSEVSGPLDHERTVNYYAFNIAFNHISDKTNFGFQIDLGLGLITLEDQATLVNNYILRSSGLGGHLSARFSVDLGMGFYLPANVAVKGFNFGSFDIIPSEEMPSEITMVVESIYDSSQNGITMNRLELGVGLGFSF